MAESADLRTIKNAQRSVEHLGAELDKIQNNAKNNKNINKMGDQLFVDRVRDADKSLRKVGYLLASITGIGNTDAKIPAVQNVRELEQKTTENKNYLADEDLKTFENMFKEVVLHLNNLKASISIQVAAQRKHNGDKTTTEEHAGSTSTTEERPNTAVTSDFKKVNNYQDLEEVITDVQGKLKLAEDAAKRIIPEIVNLSSKLQEVIGKLSSLASNK